MTTLLRDVLHDELDRVAVPPGDLVGVRRRGGRIRGARRALAGGVVAAVVAATVGITQLGGSPDRRGVEPIGPLDYSHGLRAYADPGVEVHLGGRTIPYGDFRGLDTDAATTPDGIVYYRDGVPYLLTESGGSQPLEPDAETGSFAPTAKADSAHDWVAYGAVLDGRPQVVVRDSGTGEEVSRRTVGADTVIDALDDGVVMLRDDAGTVAWDTAADEVRKVAGPKTRVADLRGSVLLYDGPRPDGPGAAPYRLVPGAIDAQLTFDGRHVLYWSPVLKPTDGGDRVHLDLPKGVGFFTVDTDGSILAAVRGRSPHAAVFDCEVPSGACEELGTLGGKGGDPEFIGNDM